MCMSSIYSNLLVFSPLVFRHSYETERRRRSSMVGSFWLLCGTRSKNCNSSSWAARRPPLWCAYSIRCARSTPPSEQLHFQISHKILLYEYIYLYCNFRKQTSFIHIRFWLFVRLLFGANETMWHDVCSSNKRYEYLIQFNIHALWKSWKSQSSWRERRKKKKHFSGNALYGVRNMQSDIAIIRYVCMQQ